MNNVRPTQLKDFLGQKHIVQQIAIAAKACKAQDDPFPHTAMGGPPGLGKTTLAKIIANEMGGLLVSRIASAITKPEDLVNLFAEVKQLNTIIFLDEIEQIDRKLSELLHTALEDGVFSAKLSNGNSVNIELPEFTLIGATNYLGELPRPFLDRFPTGEYGSRNVYSQLMPILGAPTESTPNGPSPQPCSARTRK